MHPETPAAASPVARSAETRVRSAAYPPELRTQELAALAERRRVLGLDPPAGDSLPTDTVGVALSGGGIRSATVCLGVFQALARRGLLGKVDFLSTVSGGGYFGGFWAGWIDRLWKPQPHAAMRAAGPGTPQSPVAEAGSPDPTIADRFRSAEAALANSDSSEVNWLRENGRYLIPNGGGDAWLAFATALRNLAAVQAMLGLLLLGAFLLIVELSDLPRLLVPAGWFERLPANVPGAAGFRTVWSPWLALPAWGAVIAVVLGLAFWMPPFRQSARWRNRMSRALAGAIAMVVALLGFALLDTAGASVAGWLHGRDLGKVFAGLGSVIAALIAAGQRIGGLLSGLGGRDRRVKTPTGLLLAGGSAVLALLWLGTFSLVAHTLLPPDGANLPLWRHAVGPAALLLALVLGRDVGFLNFSSLAAFYSARITRAYLGASNPARRGKFNVTETISGDEISYRDYFPHRAGGPLHLVNVTVNETVLGKSQTVEHDRKGLGMAVGPCGLSVGLHYHASWVVAGHTGERTGAVVPIGDARGRFHLLAERTGAAHEVELLSLGQWVGVSGAAFTTGLGARTSLGLSFLLGFFNVRLGWWWDSCVRPGRRARREALSWARRLNAAFCALFPTHSHLLDEMLARFPGPARQRWYLSDGGHFENTAAYELIRRRVPFIVICDDGCDPQRTLDDLGNLVRKARIDFDAEIRIFDKTDIAEHVPIPMRPHIGTLAQLQQIDPATGCSPHAAVLAWVNYADQAEPSLLLLLKPTITGRESVDVLNYHAQHPAFPQESTMDQFFDEAQWESYRKLGALAAEALFGQVDAGRPLRDAFLQPPAGAVLAGPLGRAVAAPTVGEPRLPARGQSEPSRT